MPFGVETCGLPGIGKTMLTIKLVSLLAEVGLRTRRVSNTDQRSRQLKSLLKTSEKARRNHLPPELAETINASDRSLSFLTIFLRQWAHAEADFEADVLLFENGYHYTRIVETRGSGIPEQVVDYYLQGIGKPDFVIYLPGDPHELGRGQSTHMTRKPDYMRRVSRGFEEAAEQNQWFRVKPGRIPSDVASDCFKEVIVRYQLYCERIQRESRRLKSYAQP